MGKWYPILWIRKVDSRFWMDDCSNSTPMIKRPYWVMEREGMISSSKLERGLASMDLSKHRKNGS
jgi:hypothetical protein